MLTITSVLSREFFNEIYYVSNKGMNLCLLGGEGVFSIVQGTVLLSKSPLPAGGYKSRTEITTVE